MSQLIKSKQANGKKIEGKIQKNVWHILLVVWRQSRTARQFREREREIIKRPHTARSFVRRRCNELTENVTMR